METLTVKESETKIYKTQEAVEKDIQDGVLAIHGDVIIEVSIDIKASITARNITARNITARDINALYLDAKDINAWDVNAWDVNARDITAGDITAGNITARDITAMDITAGNITAGNINARDINAMDITARDILYYAFCCVYNSIKCLSIKAKKEKASKPICLDGKLTIKKEGKK